MYVQYGSYQHDVAGANMIGFQIRPIMSQRGFRLQNVVQSTVAGELKLESGETQYDLSTKIQNLINALSINGQDFGLYHDNGTPTPYFLDSSDPANLTGNEITNLMFQSSHNGEYASGRSFTYAVRAQYEASESIIMEYNEAIQHIGDGGPRVRWRENPYFRPTFRVIGFSSVQTIVQSGSAVTIGTYLVPPPPILPRPFLLGDQTRITRYTPRRYPQGVQGYRISWHYVFNTPSVYPAFPTTR